MLMRLHTLTSGWRGPLLALLAGALSVPAFSPWGIWPLVLPSLLALQLLLQGQSPRRSAVLGFSWAFGLNMPGLWWIHISMTAFGGIPLAVAFLLVGALAAYLALYPTLACYLLGRYFPRGGAVRHLLALPALWLLADWALGHVLTGFPWLWLGYSQLDSPLIGWAPLLGVQGITLALLLSVGALLVAWQQRRLMWLLLPLLLWGGGALLQGHAWTTPGKTLDFALVQGNIAQSAKWDPNNIKPTLLRYLDMSRPHSDADVVIWPESAIPALENEMAPFLTNLDATMRDNKTGFLTGIQYLDPQQRRFYNGVIGMGLIDEAGQQHYQYASGNRYYKRHLVPIGEFVPFGDLLRPLAPFFNLPMSSFSRGDMIQPNVLVHGARFAPSICYEMAFSDELRQNVHADTDYILTVSNDSWFGTSHGPWQHMAITRMRAIEFGKPVIRATNSGVTVAFDAQGKELGRLPQFEQQVLRVKVAAASGETPYNRIGSWPLLLWVAAALLLAFGLSGAFHRR